MDRQTALWLSRVAGLELRRAMRQMKVPGFPGPYYISYLLRDEERWSIKAKFGALKDCSHERSRNVFADVRVGSYSYDQVRDGGVIDNDQDAESYGYVDLPFGNNRDGVRHGLWRLTDARFREALEALLDKKSRELTFLNPARKFKAFERRKPKVDLGWTPFPEVDVDYWTRFVERASALLKGFPDIKDGEAVFEADHLCRVFVSSEKVRLIECHPVWSVECYMWLLTPDGEGLPWTVKHTVADPAELPSLRSFQSEIRRTVEVLRRLATTPTLRSFCGPALLEPVAAGLLVHEAVGHRLEGSRLWASGEGQTFRDSLGKPILPEFLSVRDNPCLASYDGRSLIGHYRYDDEGVPARDTELVVRGTLKQFMSTRCGIAKRHRSTGHARTAYHQRPISRMGLTVVEADGALDRRKLRRRFLEEIKRQRAPFGIRIIEASCGETATDAYNFQAFLGEITLASKVYADGREDWIRGVNFVGTPLNTIRSIVAAGNRPVVDNAYCGAESGYVPVTTISPSFLVSELELQSKADTPYTPYTFPIPWGRSRGPRRR